MTQQRDNPDDIEGRRARARRTAWVLAGIVVAIFVLSVIGAALNR